MSDFPRILTAIPRRRYRYGEFDVTLLDEVQSGDDVDYRYILAFVQEGRPSPLLYICAERNPPGKRSEGAYRLRLINEAMSEVLGSSDGWRDEEQFTAEGLRVGGKVLSLSDEQAVRID